MTAPTFSRLKKLGVNERPLHLGRKAGAREMRRAYLASPGNALLVDAAQRLRPGPTGMHGVCRSISGTAANRARARLNRFGCSTTE